MLFISYGTPHQELGTFLLLCQTDLLSLAVQQQIALACTRAYSQSLAAHSSCLQGVIKAQPVLTHSYIRVSMYTVINPRPVTSISTHNSIRKEAEWRIMKASSWPRHHGKAY